MGGDVALDDSFGKLVWAAGAASGGKAAGFFLPRKLGERVAGDAVDHPVGHGLRAEGEVKADARLVPVKAPPLEPAAAALDRDGGELLEYRLAVALATVLGAHIQIFEVYARPAEEGREVVEV